MADWNAYRRTLRVDDRMAFDEAMQAVRERASASGMITAPEPLEPMLLAMLTEAYARIRALEHRLDEGSR